jgi:hypothetical protein
MNIGAIVQAKIRSPEPSGLSCCTVWKNWDSRKIEPPTTGPSATGRERHTGN